MAQLNLIWLSISAHLKMEDLKMFKNIEGVVGAANGKTVKVIIETVLLSDEEKLKQVN